MDIAVQRGLAAVDAFSCKQSYLSVLRHTEVIFQTKQTGKQIRGKLPKPGDSVMDIAVQRGIAYVDAFSCKQSYLSVFRPTEVIFQTKQTGTLFRGEDTSKVVHGRLHRVSDSAVCKLYPCNLVLRQSRRARYSGEKIPPRLFMGGSIVLVTVPSASFTLATLYTCSTL